MTSHHSPEADSLLLLQVPIQVQVPVVSEADKNAEEAGSQSTGSNLSVSGTGTPDAAHPFFSSAGSSSERLALDSEEAGTNDMQWSFEAFPEEFHKSPEPLPSRPLLLSTLHSHTHTHTHTQSHSYSPPHHQSHHLHLHLHHSQHQLHLEQIQENAVCQQHDTKVTLSLPHSLASNASTLDKDSSVYFTPNYTSTKLLCYLSERIFQQEAFAVATWLGFWSLLFITMGVSTITPIRDAVALQLGVQHMPKLTLASSVMAFLSSVPIGWLFEAPDPSRRKLWKKMGLTRGETQGSSLALFYRFFALAVISYAVGFTFVDFINSNADSWSLISSLSSHPDSHRHAEYKLVLLLREWLPFLFAKLGEIMYIAFFLIVHLMKLHAISLVWGVTTEAMEYEDVARKAKEQKQQQHTPRTHATLQPSSKTRTRLQRLALVGFGGTLGGIAGSILASELVNIIHLPGLLILSAVLLELSAQLSVELGRIMQKHWEEQQIFRSTQDLASLDPSMKRSTSLGSMKRVASGNSLMKKVASGNSISQSHSNKSLTSLDNHSNHPTTPHVGDTLNITQPPTEVDDNTFTQRLLRGITTILKSRLLMAIFTYNALFASTTVLLSFQRAELVANRNPNITTVAADTAFLAKINMASSIAVFTMQASGVGAVIAQSLGPQGSLALMPLIRLLGVLGLAWWHRVSNGQPPNLILFLILDECTRVVNLAVAKPVRESLWRGLSNEARYEAKPIVDTLANRWGAGSASFCVAAVHRIFLWVGVQDPANHGEIAGLPPIIFLCLLVAAWWAMVSVDLGQIRRKIDAELKKRQ